MGDECGRRQPQGQPQIAAVRDPALAKFTNRNFRASDLDYPDVQRAQVFIEDLKQFEARPERCRRLMFLRIGNDQTSGTAAGKISPLSAMADNDYAFGMIVEASLKEQVLAANCDLRPRRLTRRTAPTMSILIDRRRTSFRRTLAGTASSTARCTTQLRCCAQWN